MDYCKMNKKAFSHYINKDGTRNNNSYRICLAYIDYRDTPHIAFIANAAQPYLAVDKKLIIIDKRK
jgi:hypothetical protein